MVKWTVASKTENGKTHTDTGQTMRPGTFKATQSRRGFGLLVQGPMGGERCLLNWTLQSI